MRKLLLASAATFGAAGLIASAAQAQPTAMPMTPSQGMMATQPSASPPAGANNNNNTSVTLTPGPVANPSPGTVVIHINGRVTTGLYGTWSNLDSVTGTTGVVTGVGGATLVPAGTYKINPLHIATYARIYTGLDAVAANGLRYGGAIEIRENFTGQTSSTASTGASGYSSSQTLFVRRAFAYLAGDQWGLFRAGQGDGLLSLYDNGITSFQFLPSGNLNGGDLQGVMTGNVQIPFIPSNVAGNEYANNKFVYMSPQFFGFDVGLQWAPSTSNGYATGAGATYTVIPGCGVAGPGCDTLSSSTTAADGSRSINQSAAGIRYQGKFGDVGLLAYGVYEGSGHAKYNGPFIARGPGGVFPTSSGSGRFDGLSMGQVGVAVTWAGFTVGGNWTGGAVNGQLALRPEGGAMANATVVGAKYTAGPLTIGVVGEDFFSQGSPALTKITQRHEWAVDGGASYTLAPGLVGWAEYIYQHRYQGDYNFATGAAGSGAYNNVYGQGFEVGTTVYW